VTYKTIRLPGSEVAEIETVLEDHADALLLVEALEEEMPTDVLGSPLVQRPDVSNLTEAARLLIRLGIVEVRRRRLIGQYAAAAADLAELVPGDQVHRWGAAASAAARALEAEPLGV
jgi:hypothetical protein